MDGQVLHSVEEENLYLVKWARHTPHTHGYIVIGNEPANVYMSFFSLASLAHYFANLCLHLKKEKK